VKPMRDEFLARLKTRQWFLARQSHVLASMVLQIFVSPCKQPWKITTASVFGESAYIVA